MNLIKVIKIMSTPPVFDNNIEWDTRVYSALLTQRKDPPISSIEVSSKSTSVLKVNISFVFSLVLFQR